MVVANNAIKLHEIQTRIVVDHEIFDNIDSISLTTITRTLSKHRVRMKQLYTVPFERNSERVKELRANNCSHCKGNTPDNYIHALWFCPPVQRYWYRICEDLSKCLKCSIPASPLVCLLGDLDGVTTEDNTIHMAFTALCIAKKTVLMNWKNKNNLNINQYRDYLWDYISLETASADTLDQSLWAPLISSIT